jgi:hypothetical protein
MLPSALSKPITIYNRATTSPPMNWLFEPAPAISVCSNAESILLLRLNRPGATPAIAACVSSLADALTDAHLRTDLRADPASNRSRCLSCPAQEESAAVPPGMRARSRVAGGNPRRPSPCWSMRCLTARKAEAHGASHEKARSEPDPVPASQRWREAARHGAVSKTSGENRRLWSTRPRAIAAHLFTPTRSCPAAWR